MTKICSFLLKGYTKQQYPYAGAIICPRDAVAGIGKIITHHMSNFEIAGGINCFELDYRLAYHVKEVCSGDLYAIGVTIRVPDIPGPTGGIIGDPLQEISSAGGASEEIGHGLAAAAFPGGPGLVVRGNRETAQSLIKNVNNGDQGLRPLMILQKKAVESNVSLGIMLTDGTGVSSPGAVLCINGKSVEYYQLPGEKIHG